MRGRLLIIVYHCFVLGFFIPFLKDMGEVRPEHTVGYGHAIISLMVFLIPYWLGYISGRSYDE